MSDLASWVAILLGGLWVTILLSVAAGIATIIFSTLLAIASVCPSSVLRILARAYTDIFRSIPLLALLIFIYYGLGPLAVQLNISAFWLAVLSLTLSESSYLAEVYRGGLQAIPVEQREAAESLGLDWGKTLRLVVIPQALPPAIPGTVNLLIATIKDSSLASLIAIQEVTLTATTLVSQTFLPLQVYLVLAVMYVALIAPLAATARLLERWLARRFGLHPHTAIGRVGDPIELAAIASERSTPQ